MAIKGSLFALEYLPTEETMKKAKTKTPRKNVKQRRVKKKWIGWYFSNAEERLRFGDGRAIKVGITHKVKCTPIPCKQGLHASPSVLDALGYAPGYILFRVSLGGKMFHGNTKSVATERHYLARIDAEPILREFARKCALSVIHLWDCPGIVRNYLETGNESIRVAAGVAAGVAAEDAAEDAAWDAAWDAAEVTAWAIAGDTAWVAARVAAMAAAWAIAGDAAGTTAWVVTRDAQKKMLDKMVMGALAKQNKASKAKSRKKIAKNE
jgi:hypothetical protein